MSDDPFVRMMDTPDEPDVDWLEHVEWTETERQDRLLRHAPFGDPKPRGRHKATVKEWRALRDELLSNTTCRVCRAARATNLHHIVKRSQGGDDIRENLLPVCGSGTTGCHGLIEGRSRWALEHVRGYVVEHPAVLDYVVSVKGWDWLNRIYPRWEQAA